MIDKPDYTFLCSGSENETAQLGIGFMMNKTIKGSLSDLEPQNNGICKIRLKGRLRNVTVI